MQLARKITQPLGARRPGSTRVYQTPTQSGDIDHKEFFANSNNQSTDFTNTDCKSEMSVLACDIIGSTDLARSISPERLQQVIYAYHDYCKRLVQAQSGKVARYMGDDCLAFFENESACGDCAHNAVLAATSILENKTLLDHKLGLTLGFRLGVATGIVIRDETRVEQTIIGEPLHLANRLQLVARRNTMTVCSRTQGKTKKTVKYIALGNQKLKGYAERIPIWLYQRRK